MHVSQKDLAAGGFFVLVGLFYGGMAWKGLPIGKPMDMGPGYLPIVLSGALVVLGAAVVARALIAGAAAQLGIVPWRAVVMLTVSIIIFAAVIRELGLFPTVFISLMFASFAAPRINLLKASAISLCISAFCVAVFNYGVGVPIPVLGPLFGR